MEDLKEKIEDIKTATENLSDHVVDYVETYVKLTVVNATEKAMEVATVSLAGILLSFFCMFVLLFAGVGVAIWIGEAMDNVKAGYFLVAAFYILCALIFLLIRRSMIFPFVRNHIIRKVYE